MMTARATESPASAGDSGTENTVAWQEHGDKARALF